MSKRLSSDQFAEFIAASAPESLRGTRLGAFDGFWGGRRWCHENPDYLVWRDRCLEHGLTAPTWPEAYGGGGLGAEEYTAWEQALVDAKVPPPVVGFGLTMIGPTLLHYGTDAQKTEHLPAIVRGDLRWCQGYSEPGAGSDLASLTMQAQRDGDELVITGQKIWTSYAHLSDWIFALVRTSRGERKQQGITFLLIDLDSPGVEVRPIELISGSSPFCEVFFSDVRVPVRHVVGAIDEGWGVAKALLGFERSMIGAAIAGQLSGLEASLADSARSAVGERDARLADESLRQEVAAYAMKEACYHELLKRIDQARRAGRTPGPEASVIKLVGTELKKARYDLEMRIAGTHGLGWSGAGFCEGDLETTRAWLRSRANSIEGGTSEIQLNILAQRVLGLPKGSA
ncbi:MAG: acyl-CoA dehydrogenase family protein [Myxococcota bacterium]|nr:acyl-CoA dehydrogenase family protein [Myxococcota bacterium]